MPNRYDRLGPSLDLLFYSRLASLGGRPSAHRAFAWVTVVNVGAGAGSYEPTDRLVTAVEPSPEKFQEVRAAFETLSDAEQRLPKVARAAAKLHVSQPSISEQIRELEGAFGEKLFKREGRSNKLTDAG